jgi:hydrogenase maturation factor
METSGIKTIARFACPPAILGECGQDGTAAFLKKCIRDGLCDEAIALEEIAKLRTMYPYLLLISSVTQLPILDPRVAEAYWIGNSLLDQFLAKNYLGEWLDILGSQGYSEDYVTNVRSFFDRNPDLPFIPHHAYQVLVIAGYLGIGLNKTMLNYANRCLIRSGVVKQVSDHSIKISDNRVVLRDEVLVFESIEEEVTFDLQLFKDLKVGEIVAVHWGVACMRLTEAQEIALVEYTQKSIDAVNLLVSKQ